MKQETHIQIIYDRPGTMPPVHQLKRDFADAVLARIDDGTVNAIDVHYQLKAIESALAVLLDKKANPDTAKKYADALLEAAGQHGKRFERNDATFEIKETGTTFDFTQCGHARWTELNNQLEAIKSEMKAIETMLKTMPAAGMQNVDQETGEISVWYPPSKKSTTSVAVTFKK